MAARNSCQQFQADVHHHLTTSTQMEKHLGAQSNSGQSREKNLTPRMKLLKPKYVCNKPRQPIMAEKQLIRKPKD